ncbi:MAG TPA: aminotransferase class I/II-fold pyridoxal phosphate-dependent enzyme [Micromonosporaceae bacterium]|nr:aminotransferase class I/II-fold pyridoxal phosphate-dependent enzyme [Micromonosporaceae bacterium]
MAVHYQIAGSTAAEISASVEAGVGSGALGAGAALPPVRVLAERLGVSAATVASSYQRLRQRGVVETAGRHGTRVRSRPPVATSRAARRLGVPVGVLDLSAGEPDRRLLPDLHEHLRRVAAAPWQPLGYAGGGPLPELLDLARERMSGHGVPVRAAELTVTHGALDGIERLLTAHLRPGDRVAIEDPGWANLLDLIAALGLAPVSMPIDEAGPTEAGLRAAIAAGVRAAVVTSRAHNPTGAALTRDRAAALRRVLRQAEDVLVIEDDHAGDLARVPLHPLAGATPNWALLQSVSKPYGPDLRLAVLAGDPMTVARVQGRMRLGAGWVSTLVQRLVVELWRDGTVAAAVDAAARSYERRREELRSALAVRGVAALGRTGLNVWVPTADETSAVGRLRDAGYAVAPGALHRIDSAPAVRITVSELDLPGIPRLADAVSAALHPYASVLAR